MQRSRGLNEHIEAPESFCCHWLIKLQPPLYPLRREVSEGGETKQKHFVLNVGAVSRVGQLGSLMGFFSVKMLVSFCFCLIKAMGNIVERGRHPRIPEV